jgi:flagellar basal body-associated protein FliL
MKRLLIIGVAGVLLSGGLLAGLYVFMPGILGLGNKPEAAAPAPEPVAAPPVKPTLVKMTTLDVPVVLGGEINRQVHFTVTLIVAPESLAAVQAALPRLRDAFIQMAYVAFPKQYAEQGKMDLPRLKASLIQVARRVLGEAALKDVVLQSYIEM